MQKLFKLEMRSSSVLTQRPFPNFSELQLCEDGVCATPRPRDAVFMIVRASTRLVEFRDGVRATQVRRAR